MNESRAVCFSLVIPVFNVAEYVGVCLATIRNQTYPRWECVCVDDGSSDGSGRVLDDYASADARIRVIHQPNCGVSVARRNGFRETEGDYCWFVDGDDILHPVALEVLAEASRVCPHKLFSFPCSVLHNEAERRSFLARDVAHGFECVLASAYGRLQRQTLPLSVYHRSLIRDDDFGEYRVAEDLLAAQKILARTDGIAVLSASLYGYVMRQDSVSHQWSERKLLDSLVGHAALLSFFGENRWCVNKRFWDADWKWVAFGIPCVAKDVGAGRTLHEMWRRVLIQTMPIGFIWRVYGVMLRCILRCPSVASSVWKVNAMVGARYWGKK
mgnify:CR=1 FL=1